MIHSGLHKNLLPIVAEQHKTLRCPTDVNTAEFVRNINVMCLIGSEFGAACKEFPILFIPSQSADTEKPQVVPVAVMGLQDGENLFVSTDADGRAQWGARYMPALVRFYPFGVTALKGQRWALCVDDAWEGWARGEGESLFDEHVQPTAFLQDRFKHGESLHNEATLTVEACSKLHEMRLLHERVFNVTTRDGQSYSIGGFYAVDQERLASLSRSEVADLFRSGQMGMIMAHQISLDNLGVLAERRWE
ncbi:SapC family protein [Paraburkholderia susongensis]|uniref:SapC protein n=1 Tax=Paraburkholderia susongensis TaxID=1515439 RepID=A0A1X7M4K1_9BURK|nr:SapC family protein [Paraburkholderia susongensis]SMG61118.1 SapC protein [Paraburkholderia susongensis]